MVWLILFIVVFLAGTFVASYRLQKKQSRRDEQVDPAKLYKWEDDD